jgi:hypothetical protein
MGILTSMPAPKRRRWFSLSLRTVLIGVTVISVGVGWLLASPT